MEIIHADKFEEVVSQGVTVVDFFANWCGPCKMLSPILEEVVGQFEGKVKAVKVDVDEDGDLAGKFGVFSIPNLVLFKDGKMVGQTVGLQPADALVTFIKQAL